MMEIVNQWISLIIGAITLLGLTGSVSVLFYRVRRLEISHKDMNEEINRHAELFSDTKEILARVRTDVEWIRKALDK